MTMEIPIDVDGLNLLKEERLGVVTSSSPSEERLPGSLRAGRPGRRTWPSLIMWFEKVNMRLVMVTTMKVMAATINWLPTYEDFRQLHTQRCPSHQWWRPSGPDDGDDGADDNDGGGVDVVDVEEEEKEEQDQNPCGMHNYRAWWWQYKGRWWAVTLCMMVTWPSMAATSDTREGSGLPLGATCFYNRHDYHTRYHHLSWYIATHTSTRYQSTPSQWPLQNSILIASTSRCKTLFARRLNSIALGVRTALG